MKFTGETVDRIAALAHLRLDGQEREQLAAGLESIVSYMEILETLPAGEGEAAGGTPPEGNVLREDAAAPSLDRSALLANAPAHDGEMFLTPGSAQ